MRLMKLYRSYWYFFVINNFILANVKDHLEVFVTTIRQNLRV